MKDQILYLFDPLCGWCYGFSPVIVEFHRKLGEQYEFVPIPGGMITGERVRPIHEMKDYINGAMGRVEEVTGCSFGKRFKKNVLESRDLILDSEPPSRALITFRTFDSQRSMEYAAAIQTAHFQDGADYNDRNTYKGLAETFGLDSRTFLERYDSERMKQQVLEEFHWVKESGVQGYPTVVLRSASKYYMLSNGFTTLENLTGSLEKASDFFK